MKNQTITLPVTVAKKFAFTAWCEKQNTLFSWILEESSVTNRQVLLMAHASLAFSALVGAYHIDVILALVCLTWFIASLYLCVKGGLR